MPIAINIGTDLLEVSSSSSLDISSLGETESPSWCGSPTAAHLVRGGSPTAVTHYDGSRAETRPDDLAEQPNLERACTLLRVAEQRLLEACDPGCLHPKVAQESAVAAIDLASKVMEALPESTAYDMVLDKYVSKVTNAVSLLETFVYGGTTTITV